MKEQIQNGCYLVFPTGLHETLKYPSIVIKNERNCGNSTAVIAVESKLFRTVKQRTISGQYLRNKEVLELKFWLPPNDLFLFPRLIASGAV